MMMTYVDGAWRTSYENREEYARRLGTAEIAGELRPFWSWSIVDWICHPDEVSSDSIEDKSELFLKVLMM